jgi:hypothetical protein
MFLVLLACTAPGPDSAVDSAPDTASTVDSSDYAFASALTGEDSVSYGGQIFRHLLIDDMKQWLGGLTGRIDGGEVYPVEGDVSADLGFYLDFDSSTSGQLDIGLSTDPETLQQVYDDVGSDKNLWGKLAGNDEVGQHADWSTDFVGWPSDEVTTPESLVNLWVTAIDEQAAARVRGEVPQDPSGQPIPAVFLSPEGQNYRQLLEKFLRGAIALSQGADDYLDDDVEGKGLLSDHTVAVEGKAYTELEHSWDEGFGYFGASRTYGAWTDGEISVGYQDVDGDGSIDLLSEYCWGHSVNAGKRDSDADTDFSGQAFEGFREGRALLAETAGRELTEDELDSLRGHRDQARLAWEAAVASSVVHYINELIVDTEAVGSEDYSFEDHAKHWSEAKGFALSLQFNPASPVSDVDFLALHELLRTAPELGEASAREAYVQDLLEARDILGSAYGFSADNLGDEHGQGGW